MGHVGRVCTSAGMCVSSMSMEHVGAVCDACRLSEILSVLGRLMAPLVSALSGNEALVTLSIRTLEYWVDSLNPEFLEPAMLPVIPQLMLALWSHLRPLPYNFSAKVQPPPLIQSSQPRKYFWYASFLGLRTNGVRIEGLVRGSLQ